MRQLNEKLDLRSVLLGLGSLVQQRSPNIFAAGLRHWKADNGQWADSHEHREDASLVRQGLFTVLMAIQDFKLIAARH